MTTFFELAVYDWEDTVVDVCVGSAGLPPLIIYKPGKFFE